MTKGEIMKKEVKKVIGGIYIYPEYKNEYYLFMNNATYLIEGNMCSIDKDVEHVGSKLDKDLLLLTGYSLKAKKVSENEYKWQIVDSGRKNTKDYLHGEGPASKTFFDKVSKLSKSI